MVSTRSSRTSRKQSSVDNHMEDKMDKKEETVEKKEGVEDTTPTEKNEEDSAPKDKNDIGCKECLEEGKPSKTFLKKTNQVRFNEVVETREVETEYDKPDRIFNYMKAFVKRVIICSAFIMLCKTVWPRVQPVVWPEIPDKEGKLYILNDRSFRGHVSRGDHFVMMMAPWCGHCKKLKPDWEQLSKLPGVSGLSISKVDCTQSKLTCDKYDVKGYPTLLYFRNGKMIEKYSGANNLKSLKEFVKKMKESAPREQPGEKDKKSKAKKKKAAMSEEL